MALTNEDKKDVAGAMGKSVANKVDKATNDKAMGKKRDMAKKMITAPSGRKFEIIDKPKATHSWPKDGVG